MKLSRKILCEVVALFEGVKKIVSRSELESLVDEMIEDEIAVMVKEIQSAEVATGLSREGDSTSRVTGRWYSNTFPKWYRTIGVRNKDELVKIAKSKKGIRYNKLADVAKDRLMNGYETSTDRVHPDNTFRALMNVKAYDDDGSEVPF